MGMFEQSRDRRTFAVDGALAGAFAVGTTIPLLAAPGPGFLWPAFGWSVLMCSSLAFRRLSPLLALGVLTAAGTGMVATLHVPLPALLAVPPVVYSVGRYQRLFASFFVILFGVAGGIAGPVTWTRELAAEYRFLGAALLVLLCFAIVSLAYLWGRLVRERRLAESLDREIVTERFVAAQRQSAQEIELAEGRARTQVAQELHDVLAHSLSIIVVQAEGAKALTIKRPEAAVDALGVIAQTGRSSIAEVRRIVALMRGDEGSPSFGPAPTLAQIPALVDGAGARVTLEVRGEPPVVPETTGLTAYRVVQEAVTNFLKHAGPTARADVRLCYEPDGVEVLVRDDGIGSMAPSDDKGSGVRGMRDRVTAMGGVFRAGPRPGGGYEVFARLPLPRRIGVSWLREA
ncbi:sensor histidine kinase [Tessaracoccus lubricantis]|uniref:histidine kinase n=1 Tax=Tessaracoccus lubricantis TaxID=545543 RepID=A0ABP9F543_9ACTN